MTSLALRCLEMQVGFSITCITTIHMQSFILTPLGKLIWSYKGRYDAVVAERARSRSTEWVGWYRSSQLRYNKTGSVFSSVIRMFFHSPSTQTSGCDGAFTQRLPAGLFNPRASIFFRSRKRASTPLHHLALRFVW